MSSLNKEVKHWGNRYTFLEKIGKGAFGIVYKVKDTSGPEGQGSIKVLKEISIESMEKDEMDECAREGKLLSKLNHQHIVQFFDSFCFFGNYCIITEYCEGGDLNKILVSTKQKGSYLEEKNILRWFIQIIQGLDYIHKRKILHRDLKPRNIFMKSDSAKIGDFGISRVLNFTMDLASTFLGTPYYMSPEVLKHDGYNTTSDIWSAGVILYEMCSLKHAFEGQSLMDVMVKILGEPCPKIPVSYSYNLQNVIESVLNKDPSNRPSAQEVLSMSFIKDTIRDPRIDIASDLDLSETVVQKDIQEISNYMSKSVNLKSFSDLVPDEGTVMLTPKQKLVMKKKSKAAEEAEKQKILIRETYNQNKEITKRLRENSNIDSLPFTNKRNQSSRSSLSENSTTSTLRNSGSKTILVKNYNKQDQYRPSSENVRDYSEINPPSYLLSETYKIDINDTEQNEDIKMRLSTNRNALFNMTYNNLQFDDQAKCNITTYNAVDDPLYKETEQVYMSDFESDCSNSNSEASFKDADELKCDTVMEKFQDDSDTDPYGTATKKKKMHTMKKKCLEKIDEITLKKAFNFLDENQSKGNYISGLRKICKSDDVAMTVDQLYFLKCPINNIY